MMGSWCEAARSNRHHRQGSSRKRSSIAARMMTVASDTRQLPRLLAGGGLRLDDRSRVALARNRWLWMILRAGRWCHGMIWPIHATHIPI